MRRELNRQYKKGPFPLNAYQAGFDRGGSAAVTTENHGVPGSNPGPAT